MGRLIQIRGCDVILTTEDVRMTGKEKRYSRRSLLVLEGARRHICQIGILVNGFWAGWTVKKGPNISLHANEVNCGGHRRLLFTKVLYSTFLANLKL